jgi:hypothetical protein
MVALIFEASVNCRFPYCALKDVFGQRIKNMGRLS